MKRKTAMKKLMGTGLSRNEAADELHFYHLFGVSNRETVEKMFLTSSLCDVLNVLTQIFPGELSQHFNPQKI